MRITVDIPDDILHQLLDPVQLPRVARVRYSLPTPPPLADVSHTLRTQLGAESIRASFQPGQRVAIGVGSRGIDQLDTMVATLVAELRAWGTDPFIVPAMGSHGGATPEGQQAVLAHLGVSPEQAGAPIENDMGTEIIGSTADGTPVQIASSALAADAIVFVARIKPHTAFRGSYESGMAKMLAIGLGKQRGAATTHARGFGRMADMVPAMAQVVLAQAPVRFGIAVLENAHDQICELAVVPAEAIMAEEPSMLDRARAAMPHIPFAQLDVLVIDEIGKNISGDGADPNITGRYPTPFASGGPDVTRQVVLDLTAASGGNANGVGTADFTTARLARKMRLADTYPNALTSTVPDPVKLPMVLSNDHLALQAAILTCNAVDRPPRLLRLRNTLRLDEFWLSEALLGEVYDDPNQTVIGGLEAIRFDAEGNLSDLSHSREPALVAGQQNDIC